MVNQDDIDLEYESEFEWVLHLAQFNGGRKLIDNESFSGTVLLPKIDKKDAQVLDRKYMDQFFREYYGDAYEDYLKEYDYKEYDSRQYDPSK